MPKIFRFFLYIFANEISIKLFSTKKTKRNNDENKHNFAKVFIKTPIAFAELKIKYK